MENTAKQEAIKKAYGEHWENFKNMVDENGNVDDKKYSFLDAEDLFPIYREPLYGFNGEIVGVEKWRPYSIIDIDDNNGWISILSEADLPTKYEEYYVIDKTNSQAVVRAWFRCGGSDDEYNKKYWIDTFSHYQPIQKPQPPIY